MKTVFITGGTGYIGTRLIRLLIKNGHRVIALIRKGSENKVPAGCEFVIGDPFDANSFQQQIPKHAVYVQLLGVSHPSPSKAEQFKQIDLRSVKASVDAAAIANVSHFIYISVSMVPSKIMEAYQQLRKEGEEYCVSKNLNCTFIRPWYVLGPGHRWPILLLPFYGIASLLPAWRQKIKRMGLVTISQMINTLVEAVEAKPERISIIEIEEIKRN
jgi:nucleoside-diphosphate-sugar epimerase